MTIGLKTISLNFDKTIEHDIKSVCNQSAAASNYVTVDGVSTDEKVDIIQTLLSLKMNELFKVAQESHKRNISSHLMN
jgi:hypothetical protein